MELDIEGKIRSRIEAILINDARNFSELRMMATEEEPFDCDPFAEERNLYQRVINNYRNAVKEVNTLLEENVSFLSGLCRIAETIKDKRDFPEICAQIIDCVLQDLGAEFCSLMFPSQDEQQGLPLYFEGIREQQKFFFSHSHATLLANPEFARVIERMADEGCDVLNIGDVYREPRFNSVDFPSVVRSLVCLPIRANEQSLGVLILSHSLPNYFTQNHTRVLRILAAMVAHFWILTTPGKVKETTVLEQAEVSEGVDALSLVLVTFETDRSLRRMPADIDMIQNLRIPLSRTLEGRESLLPYEDSGFLILLPGTGADRVPARAAQLRAAFAAWRSVEGERARSLQMSLGYATCADGEELTRTLEVAAQMMQIDPEDAEGNPVAHESMQS
jgi:hypothetical protein